MSTFDTIVRGGKVVTLSGVVEAAAAVADGRIVAVEPEVEGSAGTEIDASSLRLLRKRGAAIRAVGEGEGRGWGGCGPLLVDLGPEDVLGAKDLFQRHGQSP